MNRDSEKPLLICVVGPTAVGKTEISIDLAHKADCEIISADSRQFYQEMTIGTSKPSLEQLASIKHHFCGHKSVKEPYTVYDFESDAISKLTELYTKGNVAILTGGSGLFVKAIIHGMDKLPGKNEELREELEKFYHFEGIAGLQKMLKKLDPVYYDQVDLKNPVRLIRAIEVCKLSGKPYSEMRKKIKKKRTFETVILGVSMERDELYHRINERTDQMVRDGLFQEVLKLKPFWDFPTMNTIGYREIIEHFIEGVPYEDTIENIKKNTRRYAKRQMTWFNKMEGIRWLKKEEFDQLELQSI